jgi:hypothetical protein
MKYCARSIELGLYFTFLPLSNKTTILLNREGLVSEIFGSRKAEKKCYVLVGWIVRLSRSYTSKHLKSGARRQTYVCFFSRPIFASLKRQYFAPPEAVVVASTTLSLNPPSRSILCSFAHFFVARRTHIPNSSINEDRSTMKLLIKTSLFLLTVLVVSAMGRTGDELVLVR